MSETTKWAIQARSLTKIYHRGSEDVRAIDGISLGIEKGQFAAFMGPSGSGKTTLINILGCLDNPSSGGLQIDGKTVFEEGKTLSESGLTKIRREQFGYIFQKFYLIPTLTVRENVMLPFMFYKKPGASENVDIVLDLLGIDHRKGHLPGELSGGEMQRVAIARALANKPEILLADEPTGNLDVKRSDEIGGILKELNEKEGLTVILVTHNPVLAKMAHRVFEIRDGIVQNGQ